MAAREFDQIVTPRSTQSRDHLDVVAARPIERLRKCIGVGSDAIDLLRELLDRLDQAGIAAQPEQCPVKMQIAVEYRQHIAGIDRGAMLALEFLELVEIVARQRGTAGCGLPSPPAPRAPHRSLSLRSA